MIIYFRTRDTTLVSVHAMKTNGGVEVGPQLLSFLTSELDQGE